MSGGSTQLSRDSWITRRGNSAASTSSMAATSASISGFNSASMAALSLGLVATWERVRLRGNPRDSPRAPTKVSDLLMRSSRAQHISVVVGVRPSCSLRRWVSLSKCLPPSILRASTRSSREVRRCTRPISRRYIRTGSSRTSVPSASCSHSTSSLWASSSVPGSSDLASLACVQGSTGFSGIMTGASSPASSGLRLGATPPMTLSISSPASGCSSGSSRNSLSSPVRRLLLSTRSFLLYDTFSPSGGLSGVS